MLSISFNQHHYTPFNFSIMLKFPELCQASKDVLFKHASLPVQNLDSDCWWLLVIVGRCMLMSINIAIPNWFWGNNCTNSGCGGVGRLGNLMGIPSFYVLSCCNLIPTLFITCSFTTSDHSDRIGPSGLMIFVILLAALQVGCSSRFSGCSSRINILHALFSEHLATASIIFNHSSISDSMLHSSTNLIDVPQPCPPCKAWSNIMWQGQTSNNQYKPVHFQPVLIKSWPSRAQPNEQTQCIKMIQTNQHISKCTFVYFRYL